MVKNKSIVQLIWHSTGILKLQPLKTLLSFEKQALHLIVLIATDHPGPLSFCPACPHFLHCWSSGCNQVFSILLFAPLPGLNIGVSPVIS